MCGGLYYCNLCHYLEALQAHPHLIPTLLETGTAISHSDFSHMLAHRDAGASVIPTSQANGALMTSSRVATQNLNPRCVFFPLSSADNSKCTGSVHHVSKLAG